MPRYLQRWALLAVLMTFPGTLSAQKPPAAYDFDAEIKRKQRELKRVLQQQKKAKKDIKRDRTEFEAYKGRTKKRMDTLRGQTTTINSSVAEWRKKYATLGAVIGRHKRTTRGFGHRQGNFKKRLITHCDALLKVARTLPPLLSKKTVAELDYLRSELKGGSTDSVEGLHRLVRIARRIDAQLMDIQVVQGSSPIPQITGTCHRLRIGGVFEAVAKGETAAIWNFTRKVWEPVKDKKVARMLMDAIAVRNGKKMPTLVRIPIAPDRSPAQSPTPTPTDGGVAADGGEVEKVKKPARKASRSARKASRSARKASKSARKASKSARKASKSARKAIKPGPAEKSAPGAKEPDRKAGQP